MLQSNAHTLLNDVLDSPVRILGIGGSVRETSRTAGLLQTVLQMTETAGAETTLQTVRDLNLPMYNEDIPLADQPSGLHRLLNEMAQAEGFIIASPTYHGSMPGALKNVFDALHIKRGAEGTYFSGRPVGLLAYGGAGGQNVINALHHTVRGMGGLQVTTVAVVPQDAIDPDSFEITNQQVASRVDTMIAEVIHQARLQRIASRIELVRS